MLTPVSRAPALRIVPLVLSALALACSDGAPPEAADRAPSGPAPAEAASSMLPTATALGLQNARETRRGLVTAGQPDQETLLGLTEAGFTTFISLRPASERGAGWEEDQASESGVSFTRIPVAGAEGLTRENVEALDRVLEAAGDTPTLLYCASGNRAGALLALRAHWIEGVPPERALALGRDAGLTGLEPAVAALLGLDASEAPE